MLDPWADPRLQPDAKRMRLGEAPGMLPGQAAWPFPGTTAGFPTGDFLQQAPLAAVPGQWPAPPPAPAQDGDITAQIFAALKSHVAPTGPPQPNLQSPVAAPEPDFQAQLLASLSGHSEALLGQSSAAGQELFRVVQQASAAPMLALPAPAASVEAAPPGAEASAEGEPMRLPSAHFGSTGTRAPRPEPAPPSPREEDAESSDDGVPHRLPPGFGAIPEDIIEERARAREEERVLRLKATQPCRFGRRCKRRDCPNLHQEGRDIDESLNPCAFGRRCKRKGCFYDHPEGRMIDEDPTKGMCKFGARCSRPDCLYDHPPGRAPINAADPRICFFCHDPGHIAGDCPRNPESWNFNKEGRALTDGGAQAAAKEDG